MHICCAGEVMLELAATGSANAYTRGVAGDSYNSAVYLAREGMAVSYLTRLGDDHYSREIVAALQAEAIDTQFVTTCPGRQPGLYLIENEYSTDATAGERSFSYWREHSPARETFSTPLQLRGVEVFYFTGITLAITRTDQSRLLDTLRSLREQGCRIVFDPNYRPALWESCAQAQEHCRAVLPLCDIALPTLEDDRLLWALDSAQDSTGFYLNQGVGEVVVKGDELTAHVATLRDTFIQAAQPVKAVDTTGAGDAFNAGYLATRLRGGQTAQAVEHAQQLAARVVQHRGAILPPERSN